MPRPPELFETGDPVIANFTYIRWLGDCKAIEEITTVWNKFVTDRTREMEEWMPAIEKLLKRGFTIHALFNNHYALCRYRHNAYYAASWIMPRSIVSPAVFPRKFSLSTCADA